MTRAFPFGLARFRFNEVRINEVPLYLRHPPIHYDVVLNVKSTTQPIAVMQTSVTGSCNSSTVIDVSGLSDKESTQTQDQLDMTCTE